MTGIGYQYTKGFNALAKIAPGPAGKTYKEAGRATSKWEDQLQRTRRMFSPKDPKLLEPVDPDPLPISHQREEKKKKKKTGRGSTILAGRMNQRRAILDTQKAGIGLLG